MLKNNTINKQIIKKIANALGELNDRVMFVGGAVVSLYIDDPAADDLRPTKDIDISLEIVSLAALENIREDLNKKGFYQTAADDVICRFTYEDIKVDVMATKAIGWAPANQWFANGFQHKEKIEVDGKQIHILPLPYFLATKFSAYHNRGGKDPRTSHDFEDITYLLDNQTQLVEKVLNAPHEVKTFLINEFVVILDSPLLQEAILANLFYETQTGRFKSIMEKLTELKVSAI